MKFLIDWKHLATTQGYISLKKAYSDYVIEQNFRGKESLYAKFQWVIGRAKHYAIKQGRSIEEVLDEWEKDRKYSWTNYYQNGNQPKLHDNILKDIGINGTRKYYKETNLYSEQKIKHRICELIKDRQRKESVSRLLEGNKNRLVGS